MKMSDDYMSGYNNAIEQFIYLIQSAIKTNYSNRDSHYDVLMSLLAVVLDKAYSQKRLKDIDDKLSKLEL